MLPTKIPLKSAVAGFTLIEMLVTITLMGLLMGAAIAGYTKFNDRQVVIQSGNEVITGLRTAQKKASVGDKPATCDSLLGYEVAANGGENTYTISANCSGGPIVTGTYSLPSTVYFEDDVLLQYQVLTGALLTPLPGGTQNYYVGNDTIGFYVITVTQGGVVSTNATLQFP